MDFPKDESEQANRLASFLEGRAAGTGDDPGAVEWADLAALADELSTLRSVQPREQFVSGLRARLMSSIHEDPMALAKDPIPLRKKAPGRVIWRSAAFRAAAAITLLAGGLGGTGLAAAASGPTDTLYPVKKLMEQAQVALAPSDEAKARLHLQFADRRLSETLEMIDEGRQDAVPALVEGYESELQKGLKLVEDRTMADDEVRRLLEAFEQQPGEQEVALRHALSTASPAMRPLIEEALAAAQRTQDMAAQVADATATTPSPTPEQGSALAAESTGGTPAATLEITVPTELSATESPLMPEQTVGAMPTATSIPEPLATAVAPATEAPVATPMATPTQFVLPTKPETIVPATPAITPTIAIPTQDLPVQPGTPAPTSDATSTPAPAATETPVPPAATPTPKPVPTFDLPVGPQPTP